MTRRCSRRTLLSTVAPAGWLALVAGCAGPPPAALAVRLAEAWHAGDREGFVAAAGPEAVRAQAIWASWQALPGVSVAAETDGSLSVRWRVPGARYATWDRVGVHHSGGLVRFDAAPGPRPVWLDGVTEVAASGSAVILARSSVPRDERARWLEFVSSAVARLRSAALDPWLRDWDGVLTTVLPADTLDFKRLSGLASGLAATGAVTVQSAPDAAASIVVNPDALALDPREAVGLLVHEGVHVVTGSTAAWTAPQWLAEGLAESVACAGDPVRAHRNRDLAVASGVGIPEIDPGQSPDPASYAVAHHLYEACVSRWGRATVHGWAASDPASPMPADAEITSVARQRLLGGG